MHTRLKSPAQNVGKVFAELDGSLRSVVPHADNDIYLAVPHPASDPVLESHKWRVIEFLRTTFFDNAPALECQLAATAICTASLI